MASMVSWVMHATIGIRDDGIRSSLECYGEGDVKSIEFSEGINSKKTTKKVQICSKVKIGDFLEYIDQDGAVKAQ